ncbi:hypothetical protein [Azospirillum soli]|uniref:hypothetical protein n=1 Tax=Azospirillum soli TaxID=1304799 RepID=UPI001AE7EB47|nr:hypothetical protein [Azospirillum soli]MBP2313025.1 hypothetical protein [Azospirillum soli]
MTRLKLAVLLGGVLTGVLTLAACGSTPTYREWTATETTAPAAFDECTDEVDTTMRLRGYPYRPLPETPQFKYRKEIFAQCMRRKGYSAE